MITISTKFIFQRTGIVFAVRTPPDNFYQEVDVYIETDRSATFVTRDGLSRALPVPDHTALTMRSPIGCWICGAENHYTWRHVDKG